MRFRLTEIKTGLFGTADEIINVSPSVSEYYEKHYKKFMTLDQKEKEQALEIARQALMEAKKINLVVPNVRKIL